MEGIRLDTGEIRSTSAEQDWREQTGLPASIPQQRRPKQELPYPEPSLLDPFPNESALPGVDNREAEQIAQDVLGRTAIAEQSFDQLPRQRGS